LSNKSTIGLCEHWHSKLNKRALQSRLHVATLQDLGIEKTESHRLQKVSTYTTLPEVGITRDELVKLKDKLRAYQILAEQSKQAIEVQAQISIYKIRADRKCGEWLADNVQVGGDKRWYPKSNALTLDKVGITRNESSRLQK